MRWKCEERSGPVRGGRVKEVSGRTEPCVGSRPCVWRCSCAIRTKDSLGEGKETFLKIWACSRRESICTPSSLRFATI